MNMLHLAIRNSPPSPNQLRKQAQIRERTEFLRRKNADIKHKVQQVKQRQELMESMASSNMLVQWAQANERRQRHLERVQERARTLRSTQKKQKLASGLATSVVLDAHTQLEWPAPPPGQLAQEFEHRTYTQQELNSAKVIQRAMRRQLLRLALSNPQIVEFVNGVLDSSIPYEKSVTLLAGTSATLLSSLLRALGLPAAGLVNGYSWFLYSVALISDFKEFSQMSASGHPGFNVNVSGSSKNALTIHLPIILYRLATRIFCEIKKLTDSQFEKVVLPFGTARLTLVRCWRQYHYYFILFKLNHRQALREIAEQALDIATTHERIIRTLGQNQERGFRQKVTFFDQSNRYLRTWRLPDDAHWASIGVDKEVLCREIIRAHRVLQKVKEKNRSSTELLYDPFLLADDHHQHSVLTFSRGGDTYAVPPDIGILNWRSYFLRLYSKDLATLALKQSPLTLHTGSRKLNTQDLLAVDLQEIVKMMHPEDTTSILLQGDQFFTSCDRKLRSLFDRYYSYCKFIGDHDELEDTLQSLYRLSSLYNLSEVKCVDAPNARTYLKLFMLLLMQLLLTASVDNSAALSFVVDIENTSENVQFSLECLCRDLESALAAKWASHCALRSVTSFIRFENMYQMAGANNLRDNLGTNAPQLRFSSFYQFIFKNSRCTSDIQGVALSMVCGTQMEPDFDKEGLSDSALDYFTGIVLAFLTSAVQSPVDEKMRQHKIAETKMLSLFVQVLENFSRRVQNLLILSTLASTLNLNKCKSTELLQLISDSESLSDYPQMLTAMEKSLSSFQWNYLLQSVSHLMDGDWELLDLFAEKLLDAFLHINGPSEKLNGNFLHYNSEWVSLYGELVEFCKAFYVLYHPVLNWIHMDLGRPTFAV